MNENHLNELMEQTKKMQEKMEDMQKQLASVEVTGEDGEGIISVRMDGSQKVPSGGVTINSSIDSSLTKETLKALEDLLATAINDAVSKSESEKYKMMSELVSGMQMPDLSKLKDNMEEQMSEMQNKLNAIEVKGEAGGGLVAVLMNGNHKLPKEGVIIDASLDASLKPKVIKVLGILASLAINDAVEKSEAGKYEMMSKMMGNMDMPDLSLPTGPKSRSAKPENQLN